MMPDPDEGLIAALFSGGTPTAIRVSIPAWLPRPDNTDISPLKGWEIGILGNGGWDEYGEGSAKTEETPAEAKEIKHDGWLAVYKLPNGFTVAKLRRLLQNLRLHPGAGEAPADLDAGRERQLATRNGQADKADELARVL